MSYSLLQLVQFPLAVILILLLISKKPNLFSPLNLPAITETKIQRLNLEMQ